MGFRKQRTPVIGVRLERVVEVYSRQGMVLTTTSSLILARAYDLAHASSAAPFAYLSLPINAVLGLVLLRELPSQATWAGGSRILLSGLFIQYLDQ